MSARTLRPTGKKILVKPLAVASKTEGGLLLAENWQTPSGQAVVVAIGLEIDEPDLKPGATVIFNWMSGVEVEHDGEKCKILRMDELLGVSA